MWSRPLNVSYSWRMSSSAACRGGMFRETVAMSETYAEARAEHGDSELLDEIVAAKPQTDHTRYHSAEELRDHGLRHLRDVACKRDGLLAGETHLSATLSYEFQRKSSWRDSGGVYQSVGKGRPLRARTLRGRM